MDNLHCERCGEEYSSTYRKCPFCQEAAAERRGRPMYRSGGRRLSKKQRSAGAGGVIKLVIFFALLIVAGTAFFGQEIAEFMGIRLQSSVIDRDDGGSGTEEPDNADDASGNTGDIGDHSGDSAGDDTGTSDIPSPPDGGEDVPPDVEALPLTLSQSAITIPAGETARVTAEGGSGAITWTSSNEEIATVDGGAVTGVAGGTVTITATAGDESVTCTVTVTGDPWVSPVELSLNRTDFTLAAGDPPFQMKVKGTESPVTWSSSNTNVATVDSDGVVRRVGKGNATITAKVDGQTLTCIVRVP